METAKRGEHVVLRPQCPHEVQEGATLVLNSIHRDGTGACRNPIPVLLGTRQTETLFCGPSGTPFVLLPRSGRRRERSGDRPTSLIPDVELGILNQSP